MFFQERLVSIRPGDRVLEVGPGSTPHPRADVLLEKTYPDPDEAQRQRGNLPPPDPDLRRKTVFFSGGRFPFENQAFDYVICSHVLEHVEDVDEYARELSRVAGRGYLEFPAVYYDYLYNFKVHKNFLHYHQGILYWLPKHRTALDAFFPIQKFFYQSFVEGYDEMVVSLKEHFFEGFEWHGKIETRQSADLTSLCPGPPFDLKPNPLKPKPAPNRELVRELVRRALRKFRLGLR